MTYDFIMGRVILPAVAVMSVTVSIDMAIDGYLVWSSAMASGAVSSVVIARIMERRP